MNEKVEFTEAVFTGLAKEVMADPELMVLTAAGLGLASRSRLLRGLGIAMSGWYVSRKVDYYMMALTTKMHLLAQVIDAGNPKEANEHISERPESGTPPR